MRLHLGASLTQLSHERLAPLISPEWVHLGDPELLPSTEEDEERGARGDDLIRQQTNYVSFFYKRGDRLPFEDDSFSFAFSEHFFEHLFLDEACELLKECFRVLRPDSCFRVVVPDADLRTYEPPEPAGFTTGDPRWFHPDKHKSRWSIYSLRYVLEEIGFRTHGVVFCDKHGRYQQSPPGANAPFYATCLDARFITDTSYILRFENSLVIDAVKRVC